MLADRLVRADVVVLTNGDRIEGEVVGQTPQQVSIRRQFHGGPIVYVENIPRISAARIEKSPAASRPAGISALPEAPAASVPASITDKPLFLRRTIEKWKNGQTAAAAAESQPAAADVAA